MSMKILSLVTMTLNTIRVSLVAGVNIGYKCDEDMSIG